MNKTNSTTTIMMVDDHKLVRKGLKSLLGDFPEIDVVAEAQNGKDAIEKARTCKPDVILLDIGLPDISGVNVVKKILEANPEQKIVMLTSHCDENEIVGALSAGANAYALKDINTELLVMVIKSVKDGAIWLDSKVVPILRNKSSYNFIPQKNHI